MATIIFNMYIRLVTVFVVQTAMVSREAMQWITDKSYKKKKSKKQNKQIVCVYKLK